MIYGITFRMMATDLANQDTVAEAIKLSPPTDGFLFIIPPSQQGYFVSFIERCGLKDLIQFTSNPFHNPNYPYRPADMLMYVLSKTPIERGEYVGKANITGTT